MCCWKSEITSGAKRREVIVILRLPLDSTVVKKSSKIWSRQKVFVHLQLTNNKGYGKFSIPSLFEEKLIRSSRIADAVLSRQVPTTCQNGHFHRR